ncbi:MAG TPA: PepSY-associated TM helix domain-containing protein, partial [Chitinophagaceae bacterium]|nr:PepSY-associated TM helix domain-containing protein [Chitinophagaceae bacterium]
MTFKKISGWLHLWLGLISGLIILVIALTGAIYEFQPELTKATQPYLSVKAEDRPFLPVSAFKRIAEKHFPGIKPNRVLIKEKKDAVAVQFFGRKPEPYYYSVYINPYSGEVLKVKDMNDDFFRFILDGHLYLWLPREVGHYVVIYGTLIFAVIIITGLVLWWPRTKARRKNSFKVKWSASPKRLNYDLHNIFGFYASWIILFAVLTGLVWGFEWAANSEYWLVSGGNKKPAIPKPLSVPIPITDSVSALDKAYASVSTAYPNAKYCQVGFPSGDSAAIVIRVSTAKAVFYKADNLYFDRYTAQQLPVSYWGKYADATAGEKAVRMNYDIHVGAIAGLPGRILMF